MTVTQWPRRSKTVVVADTSQRERMPLSQTEGPLPRHIVLFLKRMHLSVSLTTSPMKALIAARMAVRSSLLNPSSSPRVSANTSSREYLRVRVSATSLRSPSLRTPICCMPLKKSPSPHIFGRIAYHPHGDISVYDALVRMAQTFSNGRRHLLMVKETSVQLMEIAQQL